MLKYCNGCKRDLQNNNFYSYKKSTCKDCVNKKVKCGYCDREFNSANFSKHIKQRHSTYDTSRANDSTYDSAYNSASNNSTSKKIDKNNSASEITLSDQLYNSAYTDSLKNKHLNYDQKDIDKINKVLAINRKLNDKI